ncbi:hypothetical protein ABZ930_12995 [Streptomyces sp. NPDC046716]|uniref:hypothetical protein n=1 Tax=Streptomyces sp. NPDC046716 TaxID=3157093 RepID=UPI0033DA0B67
MYLVHAQLTARTDMPLPGDTSETIRAHAKTDESIEYVVVHPTTPTGPVIGLFLLAGSVEEAEVIGATVCERALRGRAELSGFQLLACEARLVAEYYDRLAGLGPPGRVMPRPDHDSGNPFLGF